MINSWKDTLLYRMHILISTNILCFILPVEILGNFNNPNHAFQKEKSTQMKHIPFKYRFKQIKYLK